MNKHTLPVIVVLCLLTVCACDSHRGLRIESSEPAVVMDWGGRVVCASTPCVMRVSRETCRFYDSSSGYIILDAKSRGGVTLRSVPIVTCDVSDSMRLSFSFPAGKGADCGVVLYSGGRIASTLSCKDSLVK
jgi:hypothetical protein